MTEWLNWTDASGSELSTLYIFIHLNIHLLSKYIYVYLNPHFIDEETADQKIDIIWVRLPKIWAKCLLFSHPVLSNHLQPHELQQVRPPYPSPSLSFNLFFLLYHSTSWWKNHIFPSFLLYFVSSAWISLTVYILPPCRWGHFLTIFCKFD